MIKIIAEKLYQNKEWLKDQYWNRKKSQSQIAESCNVHQTTIQTWMKRHGIHARTFSEACKGILNGMYGKTHSTETKKKMSKIKKATYHGESNPAWKGDDVGYHGLHSWMRRNKPKPTQCKECGKITKDLELSNNGILNRNPQNYEYLCYKCHKIKDGTIYNIKNQEGIYH